MNGHLSEPFSIASSIHQACPLLYLKDLELRLKKLEQLRGIPFEQGLGRTMSAYANNVTVMVSDTSEVETIGSTLEEYESVAGVKISVEKSEGLRLGTWRVRSRPSDGVVGHWTDRPVKLLMI